MIKNVEELNLDGFQIVKAEMFAHSSQRGYATCTIWPTQLSFSKMALQILNNCEYIRIEINPMTKCLLVNPVTSKDKDSIRWIKGKKEYYIRHLGSKEFGEQLYSAWGLDPDYNYRSVGKLVSVKGKVMLLFSFVDAESWQTKKAGTDSD